MEPDVIRIFSSSPPPMEDGAEEEDDEFGDFGTFSGVPNSISLSEFDTPTTFNQNQALTATSPPELLGSRPGLNELSKANGVGPDIRRSAAPSGRAEVKKVVSDCNGEGPEGRDGPEGLTNGFVSLDVQGSPSIHLHLTGTSTEEAGNGPGCPQDEFADFAAFSSSDGHLDQEEDLDLDQDQEEDRPAGQNCNSDQGSVSEDGVRDTNRTEVHPSGSDSPPVPAEDPGGPRAGDPHTDSLQRDGVHTNNPPTLNGTEETEDPGDLFPDGAGDSEAGLADEKGSETETETETSLGRLLSTDALEEYGDISTTGSAPSPPLQGDTATPAEDFGDFGDAGSFGGQGFTDFEVQRDQNPLQSSDAVQDAANSDQDDDFGDFNSPRFHTAGGDGEDRGTFGDFPISDSFGNFSSAEGGEADAGWSAFGDQQEAEEESWAAFGAEPSVAPPEEEEQEEDEAPAGGEETRMEKQPASLSGRLEKLFLVSFPLTAGCLLEEQVVSLQILLDPAEDKPEVGAEEGEDRSPCCRSRRAGVWTQLQDIHEALGLRYQWGGSHCNKALLCCLGIDTRNILFTGQKKQPVIVPMYAAGLGMLEPTKEPAKPVSAAEMIASIAQAPPAAPEKNRGPSDPVQQEALPPIQFDWSSSGLTNPLDASGGSSLLNLDFFGPVEDSGSSSSTSIPGVDPELFELTTAKLDPSGSGSRVADAFARLMSTMEKTSTSTRKPKKEENLSEEAVKVIAALPDLSFMQAKVLMFPATLTPLHSRATPD